MLKTQEKTQDEAMRFMFDNHGVRGEIATLKQSAQALLKDHNYPKAIKALMLELALTSTLIAATLKANGEVMIQLRGGDNAPLKYALINISQNLSFYGSASLYEGVNLKDDASLKEIIGDNGVLVISVFPEGGVKWQGIVPIEKDSIQQALEEYFEISEQLPSKFFIYTDLEDLEAYGIMLQIISGVEGNTQSLEHLGILTSTMTLGEFKELNSLEILNRLFAEEKVRVFEPRALKFHCVCSKERCQKTLMSLPRHELEEICSDEKGTDLNCAHCGKTYHFTQEELKELLLKVSQ